MVPKAVRLRDAPEVGPAAEGEHPDPRRITLEQGVHRLRGRVGHAADRAKAEGRDLARNALDRIGDAGSDAVGMVVRGGDDCTGDDGQRGDVAGDRLREGAADVDPDPHRHQQISLACRSARGGTCAPVAAA